MPTIKKTKRYCVKNNKTKRCVRSTESDVTSSSCQFFQRSQRCRSVKEEKYVEYRNYKVKPTVRTFLEKKIVNLSFAKLLENAKKDPDYEDTFEFLFEDKDKSPEEIKGEFVEEILDLGRHRARDYEGSEVLTMKTLRYVLKNNGGMSFLLM
jgi:hypothetical protein